MSRRLLLLLDRSIPPEMLADPRIRWRARLVQSFHLIGVVGFFAAGLGSYFLGVQRVVFSHIITVLLFTATFSLLRVTRSFTLSATTVFVLGLLGVAANAVEVGGLVFILSWGSVIACGAALLVGLRAAVALCVANAAIAVAMSWAHRRGVFPPVPISMERDLTQSVSATMVVVQMAVVMVFTRAYFKENAALIRELDAARAEAERLNRAKSLFLATMSHEIRTPMNGVLAASDLLRRASLPDDEHGLAELVYGSGESLLRILDDMLDLSKLEAGRVVIEARPFDPRRTVADVVELMTPRAKEKGVAVALTVDAELPEALMGDALRLRQVLLNLVANGVKFTERGAVTVTVQTLPDSVVEWSVSDTGAGMDADALARVFEPFSQADASVQRTHGGTGLGLAISKHLVEAMGGAITTESESGRGSTFRFTLTLPVVTESVAPTEAPVTLKPVGAPVLVVDDNDVNRRVAQKMLERLGIRCVAVTGGRAALEALAEQDFALVLMDRQMPDIDGLEATRRLRAMGGARATIPVLGLTAAGLEEDVAACRAAGMQEVLLKPMTLSALAHALARWT
ncbi:MAG: ATP-binding protein [Polyangiales bacterium]